MDLTLQYLERLREATERQLDKCRDAREQTPDPEELLACLGESERLLGLHLSLVERLEECNQAILLEEAEPSPDSDGK